MSTIAVANSGDSGPRANSESEGGTAAAAARGRLLQSVLGLLDAQRMPHCILHGSDGYPIRVPSDIDVVVAQGFVPWELAALLRANRDRLGAALVQWIQHESTAHYFVLAADEPDAGSTFLSLDVSTDYRRNGRVFYRGEEVLGSRRRDGPLWVPSPAIEFGCYLVKKIAKQVLNDEHGERLTTLYARDSPGCKREIARFWRGRHLDLIARVAASGEWAAIRAALPSLRRDLMRRSTAAAWRSSAGYWLAEPGRWLRRCRAPTGVHVVFLGPDGSGKSTTIAAVGRALTPAFRRVMSRHLAPALFRRPRHPVTSPHGRDPRSLPESLVKAAYWVMDYTLGYYLKVRPELTRSTLVLFDRYLLDALVDPRRYRYGGPSWLLRVAWFVVPKPDLVIALDAPAAVLRARKEEVAVAEVERQRAAYRELVESLPSGHIIDAAQPFDRVVAAVNRVVLDFLASRTGGRLERPWSVRWPVSGAP